MPYRLLFITSNSVILAKFPKHKGSSPDKLLLKRTLVDSDVKLLRKAENLPYKLLIETVNTTYHLELLKSMTFVPHLSHCQVE